MTGPRRLREESDLFASLVADAKRQAPPPDALRTLHRTLEQRPRAKVATRGRWTRTVIAGAGGIALLGALTANLWPRHEPVPAAPPIAATSSARVEIAPPTEPITHAVPSMAVDDLPDSKVMASPRPRSLPTPSPSAQPVVSAKPRREIDLVAEARAALSRGDARGCLAAVDRHEQEFPAGQLALEMKVMRIEATLASGDRAGARALAQEYLAKHSGSAYDTRVRSLAASTEER